MANVREECALKEKSLLICIKNILGGKHLFERWPFFSEIRIHCVQINICFFSSDSYAYNSMELFESREPTIREDEVTDTKSLFNVLSFLFYNHTC